MSIRTERIARLVQREVADLLNTTFQDTSEQMITVTGARVTGDLSIAYVYVSMLGDTQDERLSAFRNVEEQTARVRNELAMRIRHQVRRIPELRFVQDESLTAAARIEELLDVARRERLEREND